MSEVKAGACEGKGIEQARQESLGNEQDHEITIVIRNGVVVKFEQRWGVL
ncbi:MAG: hypothetical protein E6713_14750 [Sporomusaceae bacterium]|nr:hypothetical protein [Sporomusaceae bacterium]